MSEMVAGWSTLRGAMTNQPANKRVSGFAFLARFIPMSPQRKKMSEEFPDWILLLTTGWAAGIWTAVLVRWLLWLARRERQRRDRQRTVPPEDPLVALLERLRESEKRIERLARPHGILGRFGRTGVP